MPCVIDKLTRQFSRRCCTKINVLLPENWGRFQVILMDQVVGIKWNKNRLVIVRICRPKLSSFSVAIGGWFRADQRSTVIDGSQSGYERQRAGNSWNWSDRRDVAILRLIGVDLMPAGASKQEKESEKTVQVGHTDRNKDYDGVILVHRPLPDLVSSISLWPNDAKDF